MQENVCIQLSLTYRWSPANRSLPNRNASRLNIRPHWCPSVYTRALFFPHRLTQEVYNVGVVCNVGGRCLIKHAAGNLYGEFPVSRQRLLALRFIHFTRLLWLALPPRLSPYTHTNLLGVQQRPRSDAIDHRTYDGSRGRTINWPLKNVLNCIDLIFGGGERRSRKARV